MSLWMFANNLTEFLLHFSKQAEDYIGELVVICHFGDLASSHCVKWQSLLHCNHSTAARSRGWGTLVRVSIISEICSRMDLNGCM